MTRRFLDDVRSDIDTQIVTNPLGDITAVILNPLLNDIVDSCVQDEALIVGNTPVEDIATTVAFASLTTIYENNLGGGGDFLTPAFAAGTITTSATAGFSYEIQGSISYTDIGGGLIVNFTVMRDGVPVGFIAHTTGDGTNDPVSAYVRFIDLSAPSGAVYTLGVSTPDGADTIDVIDAALSATINPTNNP